MEANHVYEDVPMEPRQWEVEYDFPTKRNPAYNPSLGREKVEEAVYEYVH